MSLIMKAVAPAVSALALVFAVGATNAEDAKSIAPKGPTAQEQQGGKVCYVDDVLAKGLKEEFNMEAKEKGDHPNWRLHLYANNKGSWALVGEPKDNSMVQGATPDMKVSCLLEGPFENGYPDGVQQAPWYKELFKPAPAPSGPSI